MDISSTLAPNSDQLDAVDLLGGPRTFTITKVSKGNPEQPVDVHLADFPRPWRPGKSMRRVLAACWGTDASVYVGRRVRLYCDESVRFGAEVVGGTRIAALSHIDKPKSVPLLVSRGKSAMYRVEPLADAAPASPAASPAVSAETLDALTAMLRRKGIAEEKWLAGVNKSTGGAATALEVVTEDQARRVLAELDKRPDAKPADGPANEPTEEDIAKWNAEDAQPPT